LLPNEIFNEIHPRFAKDVMVAPGARVQVAAREAVGLSQ
jgi:hypothetical protein